MAEALYDFLQLCGGEKHNPTPDEEISRENNSSREKALSFLDINADVHIARAPGRLDVMGGIADYSGSLVLQQTIRAACQVACQVKPARNSTFSAMTMLPTGAERFDCPLDDLTGREAAIQALSSGPDWSSYVGGAVALLFEEKQKDSNPLELRVLVCSSVPLGRGLASSAALEVACVGAIASALGIHLDPYRQAVLAHRVETEIVGAPCGIMDQMASCLGVQGHVLALVCKPQAGAPAKDAPATVEGPIKLPEDMEVVGFDTGVTHSVGGAEYRAARIGAFMGLKICKGVDAEGKHLADCRPKDLPQPWPDSLPETLTGPEFRDLYGELPDKQTRDNVGDVPYPVRAATRHGVEEPQRVRAFADRIGGHGRPLGAAMMHTLGRIMLECHESYSRCGLGCAEGDIVRDIVVEAPSRGHPCLVGCRLSGGGCGGVVCVLLRREGEREVEAALSWLSEEYEKRAGRKGRVHRGSSMGAAEFGVRVARYVSGSGGVGEWEVVEAKHPEKDGGQAATKGGMGRTEQSFH